MKIEFDFVASNHHHISYTFDKRIRGRSILLLDDIEIARTMSWPFKKGWRTVHQLVARSEVDGGLEIQVTVLTTVRFASPFFPYKYSFAVNGERILEVVG